MTRSTLDGRYLTATEVAERLSMDKSTVYKMMDRGELPSVLIGSKSKRIPAAALSAYLAARTTGVVLPTYVDDEDASLDPGAPLQEQVDEFRHETGRSPEDFAACWRSGEIEDTPHNAQRAIRALALREACAERARLYDHAR